MKKYDWSEWGAISKDASCALITYGNSVEEIREEIDEARKIQIEKGYMPVTCAIIYKEGYRLFDDNGNFIKEETVTKLIEHYPL